MFFIAGSFSAVLIYGFFYLLRDIKEKPVHLSYRPWMREIDDDYEPSTDLEINDAAREIKEQESF